MSAWSKENASIDEIAYWNLPRKLRATTHEEVGTVVWLDWKIDLQGEYENGYPWSAGHCEVTVIDRTEGIAWESATFRGKDPQDIAVEVEAPFDVTQKGGWSVDIYRKVNEWLTGLPRK